MRKKIAILTLLFLLIPLFQSTTVEAAFTMDVTTTQQIIDGVTHRELVGTITKDGVTTDQVINYLGGNPTLSSSLHVISGDAYSKYGWGKAPLNSIIDNIHYNFDNYTVIGGINADFFSLATGIPVEAYIRNFEVLSPGLGYGRDVFGFKDNGEVVFGTPCFEGYELIIFDDEGDIKNRVDVERLNGLPVSERGTTVYFYDYDQKIPTDLTKLVMKNIEYKTDGYDTRYFGKASLDYVTTEEVDVPAFSFVIVSEDRYVKDMIASDDAVVVQQKPACGFEDVRFAVGGWGKMVTDGIPVSTISSVGPNDRHPRSAIGVKEDGTVFFVTVDGRQASNGMDGVNLYELADIMIQFGAKEAYNLDGGGSTTMSLRDGSSYIYVNSPSDGVPRQVSNGIFFVKGSHQSIPKQLTLPDLAIELSKPQNVFVDSSGNLRFDSVENKELYSIVIDGIEYEQTTSRNINLDFLEPGIHKIKVNAIGDGIIFKDSDFSREITYVVNNSALQDLLDLIDKFSISETGN